MLTPVSRVAFHEHPEIEKITAAPITPVTLAEVKEALLIKTDADDTYVNLAISASTDLLEGKLGQSFIQQVYQQTQDYVPSPYKLRRKPILEIVSIEFVPDEDAITWETLDSAYYFLAGTRVCQRSSWPSHRSLGGWRTTFKTGYHSLPETPQDADYETARAKVPEAIRLAITAMVGHLYENREGQGPDLKYEIIAKAFGALPPNVVIALERYTDRSFS